LRPRAGLAIAFEGHGRDLAFPVAVLAMLLQNRQDVASECRVRPRAHCHSEQEENYRAMARVMRMNA
jgi:hypothetical protein